MISRILNGALAVFFNFVAAAFAGSLYLQPTEKTQIAVIVIAALMFTAAQLSLITATSREGA